MILFLYFIYLYIWYKNSAKSIKASHGKLCEYLCKGQHGEVLRDKDGYDTYIYRINKDMKKEKKKFPTCWEINIRCFRT